MQKSKITELAKTLQLFLGGEVKVRGFITDYTYEVLVLTNKCGKEFRIYPKHLKQVLNKNGLYEYVSE